MAINNGVFVSEDVYDPMSTDINPLWINGMRDSLNDGVGPQLNNIWRGRTDLAAAWSVPFADLSPTGPERAALWNGGNFRANP